jgi:hypothetical protein
VTDDERERGVPEFERRAGSDFERQAEYPSVVAVSSREGQSP